FPSSGTLVVPRTTMPAALYRCTTAQSTSATTSANRRDPSVAGCPATSAPRFLTRTGTPRRGPSAGPASTSARASSNRVETTALSRGFSSSIRRIASSVTSRASCAPERMSAARATASRAGEGEVASAVTGSVLDVGVVEEDDRGHGGVDPVDGIVDGDVLLGVGDHRERLDLVVDLLQGGVRLLLGLEIGGGLELGDRVGEPGVVDAGEVGGPARGQAAGERRCGVGVGHRQPADHHLVVTGELPDRDLRDGGVLDGHVEPGGVEQGLGHDPGLDVLWPVRDEDRDRTVPTGVGLDLLDELGGTLRVVGGALLAVVEAGGFGEQGRSRLAGPV